MKYVVVRPHGDLAKIYIVSEGAMIDTPFESWALQSGKQILFATTKMHKILHSHHFAGSYENGAMYAYTYTELCAIISEHLGPCDRIRYESMAAVPNDPVFIEENRFKNHRLALIFWKILEVTIKIFMKTVSVIMFLVILPILLAWINRATKK